MTIVFVIHSHKNGKKQKAFQLTQDFILEVVFFIYDSFLILYFTESFHLAHLAKYFTCVCKYMSIVLGFMYLVRSVYPDFSLLLDNFFGFLIHCIPSFH